MIIPNTPPIAVVATEANDKKSSPHRDGITDPIPENSIEENNINLDLDMFKYTLNIARYLGL